MMPGPSGVSTSFVVILLVLLSLSLLVSCGGKEEEEEEELVAAAAAASPAGSRAKKEVARAHNNGPSSSYRLFIKPMRAPVPQLTSRTKATEASSSDLFEEPDRHAPHQQQRPVISLNPMPKWAAPASPPPTYPQIPSSEAPARYYLKYVNSGAQERSPIQDRWRQHQQQYRHTKVAQHTSREIRKDLPRFSHSKKNYELSHDRSTSNVSFSINKSKINEGDISNNAFRQAVGERMSDPVTRGSSVGPKDAYDFHELDNPGQNRLGLGYDRHSPPFSNRSLQWNGRRSTGYSREDEEVLEGVSLDDPDGLLPDPTSSSVTALEKRVQHANIRHRKSRRNFVRTRKSPKMRPRSQVDDREIASTSSDASHRLDLDVKWESSEPEAVGKEEDSDARVLADAIRSTATSLPWSSSGAPNLENKFRATGDLVPTDDINIDDDFSIIHTEEGGRSDDVDVVTKFLRIVESQHLLGENCTKGTDFNLGEGVVDSYAQERFRLEGEIAVNRANLYTRLWKYSSEQVLASEYLLHAEVLTMVELDEDIFAAGNCYDKFEYEDYLLYCPFAYRLPEGNILVKDLAVEYKYLSNTSEWFYIARKNAERAIKNFTHVTKDSRRMLIGYHTYTWNDTAHTERVEEEILSVTYEDGRWSKPYFDCGGGNIWMMTYTVPFFGFSNDTYYFKGTSGIDIDLRRVDIDQCPSPDGSTTRNIFADSDKCKNRTTRCITIPGLGFRRGSYKCECRDGFYFPDISADKKYFNGSLIEEEYEKKLMGEFSQYDIEGEFECRPCAPGCETCIDSSPCVVSLNWVMRTGILILAIIIIFSLPVIVLFTWKYGNVKVVRAASPALLRIIILGAFFIYCTTLVLYPIPTIITCTLRVWLREVGFSLSYGALMLKTWRISVIFRVRSAKAVKITDLDLMKRLGIIVGVFAVFLGIRTVVAPPQVIVSMTADDLKAFLCSTDWWDHAFTAMEMMFLVWGIRLCIMVRKAPSEFNESKFISMAIYNEFLLSLFLNVSMLFLQSPANPDLLFIIFFCHTQLTITLLIAIIFGSKAYLVFKGQGKGEDSMSMTKPMAAKFLQRPNATNSHNMITSTSSSGQVEGDVQEEFRRLYMQLEILKDRNLRIGNKVLFAKIVAMQEAANNAARVAAPPPATTVVITEKKNNNNSAEISNNSDKQNRKPSRRERKYSDGIVMKPYVNNYLANMTDKIVCATFQDDLGAATSPVNLALSPSEETAAADGSISLRSSSTIGGGVVVVGGGGGGGEEEEGLREAHAYHPLAAGDRFTSDRRPEMKTTVVFFLLPAGFTTGDPPTSV
ncbi:LOW QUALITY PROTEIN: uncharacterized protein LOC135223490 [Macrobrachium nipponense]|uniref:LOW QUALITY PROTEIN: uncharacterized protein LOC135223490 n=1 Tax=Macrobrachium nipponense TaxID=159736 RepID=UPI0030C8B878